MTRADLSPAELFDRTRAWLAENAAALEVHRAPLECFDDRVEQLKDFQRVLFEAGWVRYGWPRELEGLGGSELHRAAVYGALADAGYPPRSVFEHLDIIIPTLARFSPTLAADLVPRMLRGDEIWCQGFSEPEAGSDLAALRTRADRDGDGFVLRGHKIWTSWAKWARRCMVLARTGQQEERHRALTMFVVDTDAPGMTVRPILQANGTPEFAEVFFDDVPVSAEQLVGEVDGGWGVAMYLLSCERGSYAWQRHEFLRERFAMLSSRARSDADHERLAHGYADLLAVRTRAWSTQCALARGEVPGPEAAVNKILITETEQSLYDAAAEILGHGIETGVAPDAARWQEDFLFSRATSIYGGSRQIQLTVVARHLIGQGAGGVAEPGRDDWVDSITRAVREAGSVREALDGLRWWDVSGACAPGEGRIGFGALFEVLGRELATGPALGAVLARPILEAAGITPSLDDTYGTLVENRQGCAEVLCPGGEARQLVVKLATGWGRVSTDAVRWRRVALDPEAVRVGSVDSSALVEMKLRGDAEEIEERSMALGRTAICFEILGASGVLLDAAAEHARTRRQFGRPLADFQAVQHLLAEAHVELAALRELCQALLVPGSDRAPEPEAAALAKLRVGRAGRTIAQHCLQIFGAVGFTEEHLNHRYARRIMTVDSFLGGGASLARDLGARAAREGRSLKGLPFSSLRGATE